MIILHILRDGRMEHLLVEADEVVITKHIELKKDTKKKLDLGGAVIAWTSMESQYEARFLLKWLEHSAESFRQFKLEQEQEFRKVYKEKLRKEKEKDIRQRMFNV
jgi:hypothetical protein